MDTTNVSSIMYLFALILCLGILIYLVYALVKPEKF